MKFNETIGKGARLAVMAGLSATLALGGVVAPVTVAFAAPNATITVNSPSGVTLAGKYKVTTPTAAAPCPTPWRTPPSVRRSSPR